MLKIPKNCLTCKFMDFVDDELEVLHCFEPHTCDLNKVSIKDGIKRTDTECCVLYKLSSLVKEDAKSGCW